MTSHQVLGGLAKAFETEIPGRTDEVAHEPVGAGRILPRSAGPAVRARRWEARSRRWTAPEAGPTAEPRLAGEEVEGRPRDWLSRWTGSRPEM